MDVDLRIAEAGIDLALSSDVDACCMHLHDWASPLTGAARVAVAYDGDGGPARVGASSTDGDGWARVDIEHPPNEPAPHLAWSAQLWLEAPSAPRWEAVAATLARQAGVGFSRVLRRELLARHERQQHALVEAGKALSSERTLDGVLHRIIEQATELTGARYGALGVLDERQERLASFVTVGIDDEVAARIGDLPTGRGILGVLIDDPRPLRMRRIQDDARSVGFPEHHPPMESFLGVPIVTSRSVAGRIYLTEKSGASEFTEEDERLVATLASQAAIAIDNASLNEQVQRTAAELETASRHKSTFLANMSHELRSPLNTIIGYTRLLLEDPRGLDEEQLEDLQIVRGSGEHLLALITDLLDLQRIEAGRVQLVVAEQDLAVLFDAVAASIRPSLNAGVELRVDVQELRDPVIRADRTRLRQVLLNVVGNAAKFTHEGEIVISAGDTADDHVLIEVRDDGPGIPLDDQQRIFELFFQSQAALGRTPGPREGAGLGLAITRMLVEAHGGTVSLASRMGEGTTVSIRLPRVARETAE